MYGLIARQRGAGRRVLPDSPPPKQVEVESCFCTLVVCLDGKDTTPPVTVVESSSLAPSTSPAEVGFPAVTNSMVVVV